MACRWRKAWTALRGIGHHGFLEAKARSGRTRDQAQRLLCRGVQEVFNQFRKMSSRTLLAAERKSYARGLSLPVSLHKN